MVTYCIMTRDIVDLVLCHEFLLIITEKNELEGKSIIRLSKEKNSKY